MRNYIIIVIFFSLIGYTYGQNHQLSVKLCDKETRVPLPFAAIYNYNLQLGTISDDEGNVKINFKTINDSIQISYLGYEKKVITLNSLGKSDTIFLQVMPFELSPVTILAENLILDELVEIIQVNKKAEYYDKGKASLLLQSFLDNKPLERQESIGNFEYKLGRLNHYDLFMGRFGQSKDFNFYTFSATDFLKHIDLFDFKEGFPEIITQCSKRKIRKTYELSKSQKNDYAVIYFRSKNGKQFSGNLYYHVKTKRIISLKGHITSPHNIKIYPIFKHHHIRLDEFNFEFTFKENPHQLSHIKGWYDMSYNINQNTFHISSDILFVINETHSLYELPYWGGKENAEFVDYQKIASQYYEPTIWESNFLFNESKRMNASYIFFRDHGLVMNFDKYSNHKKLNYFFIQEDNTTPLLLFSDLNDNYEDFGLSAKNMKDVSQKIYQSELSELSVYYLLEKVFDSTNNQYVFRTKTVFDKFRSCYFLNKNLLSLLALNLYLDVYRKNNIELNRKLKPITDQKSAIKWVDKYYEASALEAKILFHYLNDKKNVEYLIERNERMEQVLQKDNLKNIIASNPTDILLNAQDNIDILFRIAKAYEHRYRYDKAIYFYEYILHHNAIKLEEKTKTFVQNRLLKLRKKSKQKP